VSPPPRRQSSTSVDVDVRNPSTESLPSSFTTNPPQITDDPSTIDSTSVHSSLDSLAVDQYDEPSPSSPTPSIPDYSVPEGRFVRLINSDEIPRYTKDVTMQVVCTILSLHPYISLQTPRGDSFRGETFNNHIPPVRCNFE
jgi:hypothetical protein